MSVADFSKRPYLQRADILIMRGHKPFSKAIRYATNSPFSHAAMVFLVPEPEQGFEHTFILEAVPLGVDVSRLAHDVDPKKDGTYAAAVAVVRLSVPWFTDDLARTVRGHTLNFIEAGYDWTTCWDIAKGVILTRLFGRKEEVPHAFAKAINKAQSRGGLAPGNFVCSGLVQYGYLRALRDLASGPNPGISEADARLGLFNPRLKDVASLDDMLGDEQMCFSTLLSTTPDEISRCPQLEWKYVILKGQVYSVANRDEAVKLVEQAP
jgi:hypothetical protein